MEKIIIKYLSKKYNKRKEFIETLFKINEIDDVGMIEGIKIITTFLKKKLMQNLMQ